ncbi:unnamed protein product, partial [Mesorhabditis spiculigera]
MWLSLALFLSLSAGALSFVCPPNSTIIPTEHQCILPIPGAVNYINAVRGCDRQNSNVIMIKNAFENAVIYGVLVQWFPNADGAYIGVERATGSSWVYSDGTNITYANWDTSEPSTGDCVMMDRQTMKWKATECSTPLPYFCGLDGDKLQCPDGWAYAPGPDACYYVQDFLTPDSVHWQLYDWDTAEQNCRRMGAHLASIHTDVENDFIHELIFYKGPEASPESPDDCEYSRAWIGLYGTAEIGETTPWTDGTFVDYRDPKTAPANGSVYWTTHAASCLTYANWEGIPASGPQAARYVCKKENQRAPEEPEA